MMNKNVVIFMCKAKPHRGGGGLGVAYNFLSGFAEGYSLNPETDVLFLIGEAVVKPPKLGEDIDEYLSSIEQGKKTKFNLFLSQTYILRKISNSYTRAVVISFTPFYFWPIAKLLCPNICSIHVEQSKGGRHTELAEERGAYTLKERFIKFCVNLNFRYANWVIFPSRGALNLFLSKNSDIQDIVTSKVKFAYNGVKKINTEKNNIESDHELKIVSVAHHVREKGLDVMIDGLIKAKEKHVKFNFINYGQITSLTPEITTLAEQGEINKQITFAGLKEQKHVRASLEECDVFLHTPKVVVFDLSLLEAMMYATPIVVTPLEGNREALGENYPLYASDADEVSKQLAWISSNRMDAIQIGYNLRERALKLFTNEAMVGHYCKIIDDCLNDEQKKCD